MPGACRTGLLFLRGHRARVARLPVGEPEGLMPNLLSNENCTDPVKEAQRDRAERDEEQPLRSR